MKENEILDLAQQVVAERQALKAMSPAEKREISARNKAHWDQERKEEKEVVAKEKAEKKAEKATRSEKRAAATLERKLLHEAAQARRKTAKFVSSEERRKYVRKNRPTSEEEEEFKKIMSFVVSNHEHLTMADMADELNCDFKVVVRACYQLGVTAITRAERNAKFILDMYKTVSKATVARRLDVGLDYLSKLYRELKIEEPEVFKPPVPKLGRPKAQPKKKATGPVITPRQIFSEFKLHEAHHYVDTEYSMSIFEALSGQSKNK